MLLMNQLDSICDALLRIFQSDFKLIVAWMHVFEPRWQAWRYYIFFQDLTDLADRNALDRFLWEAPRLKLIFVD